MKKSFALPLEPAVSEHAPPSPAPDLELPAAPDFVSRRTPLSLEQVLPLLEERRRWFPVSARTRELRERRRVKAEFIL